MDLEFIAGDFFEIAIPKYRAYLNSYFATEIQQQFLRYMVVFDNWRLFPEHTGYACTKRNLQVLNKRLKDLEKAHAQAKATMDFEALERLEKGRYFE